MVPIGRNSKTGGSFNASMLAFLMRDAGAGSQYHLMVFWKYNSLIAT
jgi:hypothetical protein